MNLLGGGVLVAALTAIVTFWAKIRRRRRLTAGLHALRGKVVLITGASSGLGEGSSFPASALLVPGTTAVF